MQAGACVQHDYRQYERNDGEEHGQDHRHRDAVFRLVHVGEWYRRCRSRCRLDRGVAATDTWCRDGLGVAVVVLEFQLAGPHPQQGQECEERRAGRGEFE